MRIVYCLPQIDHPGGIERIESIKANCLVKDYGCEVYIIVAQQNGEPYYDLDERVKIINLGVDFESTVALPLFKRLVRKSSLKKIYKQRLHDTLCELKPDITISTFNQEADILPFIEDGSKKILELHFCRHYRNIQAKYHRFPLHIRILYNLIDWYEERSIFRKYDNFVVLTKEDAADWQSFIPNVIYIPNMITLENRGVSCLERKEAIAVGRLDGQKGFDSLISIWNIVHQSLPDWNLNIYGDGQDREKLQKQINSLGLEKNVFLCGSCKNIQDKYLESSIILMTSNYEGWGLVLTEAMQCGLPAIAYNCKCGPTDIIKDESDGYIIDYGNQELFAKRTIELLKDHDRLVRFGYQAKKNVQRYSPDIVMQQWYELFKIICNNK